MSFPKDFLFGVATSAAQIEGAAQTDGKGLSIWDVFSRIPGKIAGGATPGTACGSYHLFGEDIRLMREIGVKSYRFSISWPRVLPDGTGRINQKGLDYYRRLIDGLNNNGIAPNVTLYHWDLPYELECCGGFLNRDVAKWFGEYASLIFREFGKAVPLWTTVNEPIATYVGYARGGFAPGRKLERFGREANHNILLAHAAGVEAFRGENLKDSKIGIVVDIWQHHPANPASAADTAAAEDGNERTYRSYLDPIFIGRYSPYLLECMEKEGSMPDIRPGDMERISAPIDFFGLNCYNRVVVSADKKAGGALEKTGGNFLDNGAEFYPQAVYDAINMMYNRYDIKIPIYVTENGTYNCSEEVVGGRIHDADRIKYVRGFLEQIERAIDEGRDIRGYYLWSLMDNFEWSAGMTQRFGIAHTDFDTLERTLKDSAYWYRDFIKNAQ